MEYHSSTSSSSSPISAETFEDIEAGIFAGKSSRKAGTPTAWSRLFCDPRDDADELHHHYLDACFRCRRLLAGNKDIFMYRGDMPFCSEECRQEQIEIDEATERKSKQPMRKEQQTPRQQKQSPQRIPVWAW